MINNVYLTADEFAQKVEELKEFEDWKCLYAIESGQIKLAKYPNWYEDDIYISPFLQLMTREEVEEFVTRIDRLLNTMWFRNILDDPGPSLTGWEVT